MSQKWLLSVLILTFFSTGIFLASCATDNGTNNDATVLTENKDGVEPVYLGSEVCIECHEDHLYDLPKNKHWQKSDLRTPGANENGCEICHGPGGHHLDMDGDINVPGLITFGKNANAPAKIRNDICLNCHQSDVKQWQGSLHDTDDMSCASCHSMHHEHHTIAKLQEQTFCYSCHQNVRSETYRPSRHPIREELVRCTDCHNPHGSAGPALLNQLTLNDNCYTCHAEKRGPYLWEHEPVSEDCGICHVPHGSLHPALLNSRPPLLCQQCHQSTRITHARQGFFFGKEPPAHKGGEGPGGGEGPVDGGEGSGGEGSGGEGSGGAQGGNSLSSLAHDDDGHDDDHDGGDQDQDQDQDQDHDRDRIQQGPGEDRSQEGGSSRFLLGSSCLNCHSQVHGSNHPSGVKLMR